MRDEVLKMLAEIRPDVDFASAGGLITEEVLDSLDMILLLSQIMEKFGVEVPVEMVREEWFDSAEKIAELLENTRF